QAQRDPIFLRITIFRKCNTVAPRAGPPFLLLCTGPQRMVPEAGSEVLSRVIASGREVLTRVLVTGDEVLPRV
ncbi:hypothetical protein EPK32_23055, partial [Shigella sonnei]|nr:hypothetical protein [Shigella sonnei]EFY1841986.1 hypothetical protein [Shigella sonnei]